MAAHYTYLDHVIPQIQDGVHVIDASNTQKFLFAVIVAAGLVVLGKILCSRIRTAEGREANIIPNKKASIFGICDFFMEAFIQFHDSVLGKHGRKYVPFTASIFFFILTLNLLGLIPGMPAATTTVWLNVAMALVVFVHFNIEGIKEQGLIPYLKHFMGPLRSGIWLPIGLFMFCLEGFSTCLRVLTLNLRLYWNISADHEVLSIFSNLLYPGLGAPFYVLGAFVSFMQAFVFTILTMVYILLASQHEEEH